MIGKYEKQNRFLNFREGAGIVQERIIQLAIREIHTKGLKFTMAELARQAGMSTKTLYGYFSSKEELISVIIERGVKKLQQKEAEIIGRTDIDLTEKLKLLLALVPSGFGSTHIRLWYELKRYYPEQWALVEDCLQNEWEHVRNILERGMAEGTFQRVSIPVFIHMYIGSLEHLVDRQVVEETNMTMADALDAMIEILLHGIAGGGKKEGQR
ncbi:transcriptional regulator [Brevibacillus borstelensis AK1]|uniref:Transcriptional regulator n=1 Tax=Brevibacillus borstelensis AK1 TaxID=1300222 RepID=M8DW17_9BACL|nr:transcriptional regulator [Brevibacillus borstelensis AK1]